MATELFTNNASTTVSSGGTTAPASGTSETWTVASSASFPAAVTGTSQFHVADAGLPAEKITVTNVSGTTWTVTRGAEGTTPAAHVAGFAVNLVVTAGDLAGFVQGTTPAAPASFAPANPTGTVSNTALVMMGVGSTCAYTPKGTGHVLVIATCTVWLTTGANNATVGCRYGTGTAPANGAAVTGTSFGTGSADELVRPGAATAGQPFAAQAMLSLTAGTAYWFDFAVQAPGATNTTSLQNISVTVTELPV